MARRYAETGTQGAVAATNKTSLVLVSAATIRPKLYDFSIGASGTPADNVLSWQLQRFTAAGTTTAVTPVADDPADPAALASAGSNASAEPTYTANTVLFSLAMNQRASYRWVAAPSGEIICPATAANGVGMAVLSPGYTGGVTTAFMHEE